jgi:uncharacterized protein (TIGR02118 family)
MRRLDEEATGRVFKVVTLVKRKPGLSVDAFQTYWRDRHRLVLARLPLLRRYVQSAALPQGYKKGELLFDGIGETWFDSEADFDVSRRDPIQAEIAADEANFLDRAKTVVMPVDVHVIKDGTIPENAVKNIEFVNHRPGIALGLFQKHWREIHGPIAAKIPALQRYEQNHLRASVYAADPSPPYDGLAITWFRSTADMKAGTTTPEYAATRADEPRFLPDGHLPIIITREHVVVG